MSGLISDLLDGSVSPNVANAVCNAGGKLLRIVELQYLYGSKAGMSTNPELLLASGRTSHEPRADA